MDDDGFAVHSRGRGRSIRKSARDRGRASFPREVPEYAGTSEEVDRAHAVDERRGAFASILNNISFGTYAAEVKLTCCTMLNMAIRTFMTPGPPLRASPMLLMQQRPSRLTVACVRSPSIPLPKPGTTPDLPFATEAVEAESALHRLLTVCNRAFSIIVSLVLTVSCCSAFVK